MTQEQDASLWRAINHHNATHPTRATPDFDVEPIQDEVPSFIEWLAYDRWRQAKIAEVRASRGKDIL